MFQVEWRKYTTYLLYNNASMKRLRTWFSVISMISWGFRPWFRIAIQFLDRSIVIIDITSNLYQNPLLCCGIWIDLKWTFKILISDKLKNTLGHFRITIGNTDSDSGTEPFLNILDTGWLSVSQEPCYQLHSAGWETVYLSAWISFSWWCNALPSSSFLSQST